MLNLPEIFRNCMRDKINQNGFWDSVGPGHKVSREGCEETGGLGQEVRNGESDEKDERGGGLMGGAG